MECNFSSTSTIDAAVSRITLMGAFKSYFSYVTRRGCGIPYIELLGNKSDWEKLKVKAEEVLKTFEMDLWMQELTPIFEKFVDTAAGEVDQEFWANIARKFEAKKLGPYDRDTTSMKGWLTKFFPVKTNGEWKAKDKIKISEIPTHVS